ncbi:OmpA family protein [Pseudoalteromonas piscicida]|uniref:OmpA family protein n=1 Tax=Pseudoalteromonas piscicida TaxID=43662 RepID=UPI000E35DEB0|nr:OmpA family protein [Pseudoalteromonas piscicida]AXQ99142.1 hypothetical protein D0N37_16360 [Pseudoalteromonas piscicida]
MTKTFSFHPLMVGMLLTFPTVSIAGVANSSASHRIIEPGSNTERVLVQKYFVLHALSSPKPQTHKQMVLEQTKQSDEFIKDSAIRFVSGKHYLTGSTRAEMDRIIGLLANKQALKLHFIGHADNQRLSANAKKIYRDNQDLSEHRAQVVADFFQQQLGLDPSAITTEGRSSNDPVASNATLEGMARNRRVEVIAVYMEERQVQQATHLPVPMRENLCGQSSTLSQGMSITLDGNPFTTENMTSNADVQRCADIALDQMELQLKYDPLNVLPQLNVQHALTQLDDNLILHLKAFSNYQTFIDYAEVHILAPDGQKILEKVPLNKGLTGQWQLPANMLGMSLRYKLRVYDNHGHFDETALKYIDFRPQYAVEQSKVDAYLMTGFARSTLKTQNIKLAGGTLTLYGEKVPLDHHVYFLGRPISLTRERKFVHQQIVHTGFHRAEVAVLDNEGNGQLIHRDLEIQETDWFYVAMADLTVGQNKHNGSLDLVGDTHNQDGNLFSEARLAAYVTGKWRDEYKVTAKIDTQEQPLNRLLSGLHEKDPRSLFRRLEESQHPAEYGDDSQVVDDAPSNGKVYLKVAKDKSHIMWGNFHTQINDTDLARVERGLYGLSGQFNSQASTDFGAQQSVASVFVAQAETLPAYESHRATGGSLYYLEHQDIVQGSEQLSIEIRDKITGLVLVRRTLSPGQDYDIDALQGRVLLSRPVSSFEQDDLLIRTATMDANPVFIVAQYEYTPGFEELDNLTYGGRFSRWFNDQIRLGTTYSKQQLDSHDDTLVGIDATYRFSESAYITTEIVQTEGLAELSNSFTGGLDFSTTASSKQLTTAKAKRVEAVFALRDIGLEQEGNVETYWQHNDAGFAATGQVTQNEIRTSGVKLAWQLDESAVLTLKADEKEAKGQVKEVAAEVNASYQYSDSWLVETGLRINDKEQSLELSEHNLDDGVRADVAIQLSYQTTPDWQLYGFVQGTLESDPQRRSNNRVGVGGDLAVTENISLSGEISEGNLGEAGKFGISYDYQENSQLYMSYRSDPDGQDLLSSGEQQNWITGAKHRFNDSTSVYAEQVWQQQRDQTGLTHAYGIDHQLSERWQTGLSFETGRLESPDDTIERDVTGISLAYHGHVIRWTGSLEYRQDDASNSDTSAWLTRQNITAKFSQDWRSQLRLDWAKSDGSKEAEEGALDSQFTEAQFGIAYRPVEHSPWSGLASFTFLEDLAPAAQLSRTGSADTPQQRSRVWALDVDYRVNHQWTVGTKLAQRNGALRLRSEGSTWFDSTASLQVLRADYHLPHQWDVTAQWRRLSVDTAQDERQGALFAVHKHVGEHMKVGVGYNFTHFSDDLTDLSYDSKGWFLNIVGKF